MKKYIVIVDDIEHVVYSTASEWFVLTSVISHIPNKKHGASTGTGTADRGNPLCDCYNLLRFKER